MKFNLCEHSDNYSSSKRSVQDRKLQHEKNIVRPPSKLENGDFIIE